MTLRVTTTEYLTRSSKIFNLSAPNKEDFIAHLRPLDKLNLYLLKINLNIITIVMTYWIFITPRLILLPRYFCTGEILFVCHSGSKECKCICINSKDLTELIVKQDLSLK